MSDIHTARVRMLLNLVSYLKSHPSVKLVDLAALFGMSEIEMEKVLLTEVIVCGVPPYSPTDYITVFIDDSPKGKAVRLHQHEEFKRPVKLTSVEALALKTAIETYARAKPSEYRALADSLLEKIARAMGSEELIGSAASIALPRQSHQMKSILADIDMAIADRTIIEIEYFSAQHASLSKRHIHPYTLFEDGSRFYVRAYCEERRTQRTFRVDRIRNVDFTDDDFSAPKVREKKTSPKSTPGWDGTKPKGKLIVRFEPHVAEEIEQEWAPRKGQCEYEKDGSLILRLPLYSEAWALGWVLSFGSHAELLEPAHLRHELISRVRQMLQQNG